MKVTVITFFRTSQVLVAKAPLNSVNDTSKSGSNSTIKPALLPAFAIYLHSEFRPFLQAQFKHSRLYFD